jgi:hypothetical protein
MSIMLVNWLLLGGTFDSIFKVDDNNEIEIGKFTFTDLKTFIRNKIKKT